MDKFEYKVRADEIKELIARGEYVQAAEIADTIDWRRVKSVVMLCTISDLYKINRRYEDARNMLLLAYERRPGGRTICYALCELCIKTEEFVQAVDYYKQFVQAAPKDPGRYILQYKLYEAQDVSLEERIGVLEELKKRDYREKWAYELAYLYHRVGLATKCVEECDELILWFGDGKYVVKAMELKMLHQPLDFSQQEKYDRRFEPSDPLPQDVGNVAEQDQGSAVSEEFYDDGQLYAASMEKTEADYEAGALQGDTVVYETIRRAVQEQAEAVDSEEAAVPNQPEELDIQVKTMDMGKYNTINLQAELAAGLREVLEDEHTKSAAITRSIVAPMLDTESLDFPELEDEDINESDVDDGIEQIEGTEVFFGDTGKLGAFQPEEQPALFGDNTSAHEIIREVLPELQEVKEPEISEESDEAWRGIESDTAEKNRFVEESPVEEDSVEELPSKSDEVIQDETAQIVMNQLRMERLGMEQQALTAQPPKELAGVLSQESDGQISLVIPERETVEKQITGQMNIQDVLAEWEKLKQESQERREEEVRQRVLQQTGNMFTEFEASVRDGLLEQLESGAVDDIAEDEPESPENAGDLAGAEEAELSENAEVLSEAEETESSDNGEDLSEAEVAELSEDAEGLTETELSEGVEAVDEQASEESGADLDNLDLEDLGEVEELEEIQEEAEELPQEPEEPQQEAEELPQELEEPQPKAEIQEQVAEPGEKPQELEVSASEPHKASDGSDSAQQPSEEREKVQVRALTQEEKELFAPYIQSKAAKEQLVQAIDNISLAAYTGNVIITGDEGMDTTTLAKNMIREVQLTDSNFSGKVAKISGSTLNKKDVAETIGRLKNGALIIQKASEMNRDTAAALYRELQQESLGIIVVLEDSKKAVNKFLEDNKELAACFTSRMNVEALSNDTLVAFGRQYAKGMEYSIDDLGILALHTRIDELQTIDHAVTVLEVKKMVDEAIRHANRKTLGHFLDILMAKRYDDEDMIILTEKDFV